MSNDHGTPWWTVTVTVGQARFGGMGESLAEATEHLRGDMIREGKSYEHARSAVEKELDRVRL